MDDAAYQALMAKLSEAYPDQPAYRPADVRLQSGQITQQQGQDPVILTNPRTLQQGESNPIEFDQSGGVSQLGAMMNAGRLRGMLDMSGQDGMTPGYNAMLTAGGPDGFSTSYRRSNEIGGRGDAQNAIMIAKQFGERNAPSPSLSAGANWSGTGGPITYDLSGSVPLTTGRNPEAPQFRLPSSREEQPMVPLTRRDRERQPSRQEVKGAISAGLSHSPRDHSTRANAGLKFNYADGGHVDAALHLLRQHFDEGGFLDSLRSLFSGDDYQSTGDKVIKDGEVQWGNPESAADFFRAAKARMALDKAPDVAAPLPLRRPAPEAAPAPAPAPEPQRETRAIAAPAPAPAPISIPYTSPFLAMPHNFENETPGHLVELPTGQPGYGQAANEDDGGRTWASPRVETGQYVDMYTLPEAALKPPAPQALADRAVALARNEAPAPPAQALSYAPPQAAPSAPAVAAINSAVAAPQIFPVNGTFVGGPASHYGAARGTLGDYMRLHAGTDWQANNGTPVYSTTPGKVVYAGNHSGYGNMVDIAAPDGTIRRYAVHSGDVSVAPGTEIRAGQPIGTIGGQHLHHEVIRAGTPAAEAALSGQFGSTQRIGGAEHTTDPASVYGLKPGTAVIGPNGLPSLPKVTNRAVNYPEITDQEKDLIAKTIAAEASGKSPEEAHAIANVILNRAIAGGRYGKSIRDILLAENQFEPWSDESKANYPMKFKPGMPAYDAGAAALRRAYDAGDITGGSTYFWAPKPQGELGRNVPDFAKKYPGFNIGATRFHRETREAGGEVEGYGEGGQIVKHALDAIRGWHGSGRQFKQFDPSKMGSGAGELFGRGVYITDTPNFARTYRNMALKGSPEPKIGGVPVSDLYMQFERQAKELPPQDAKRIYDKMQVLEDMVGDPSDSLALREILKSSNYQPEAREWFESKVVPKLKTPGGLYEVEIKAKPEQFLQWQKPFGEQSPFIQDALRPKAVEMAEKANQARAQMLERGVDYARRPFTPERIEELRKISAPEDIGGLNLYGGIHRDYGSVNPNEWQPEANQFLRDQGVVGNTYRDMAGKGKVQNYVVYDPADTEILNRYAHGGEIHGDGNMSHDDIVSRALHAARRHFNGLDGSYVDPMGNVAFPAAGPEREQAPIATDNAERMRAAEEKARLARDIQAFEASNARIDAQPQWAREMTHRPSEPRANIAIDAFGRERVLGNAPYPVANPLSSLAQFGYGLKTAPLYAAGAAFPPAAMLGTAIDTAEGIAAGSPTQVAMGAFGMPASAARNVFAPLAVASGLTAPDEAEAARAPKIGGALAGAARGELSRVAPKAVDPSLEKAFDIVRSATAGSGEAAFPQLPASVRALDIARGEAPPSDVVSGMTGAFAPKEAPIRGQTGLEIRAMQERALNPEEMDKLTALRAQSPEFAQASRFMLPEELKGVIANPRQIEPMMRLLEVIPQAEQMSSLAKAGAPKQGWYRGSTQALMDVFGPQDAPRFSALLAATSPQTSVESNLLNTLNIWKNWEAAGRPTDPAAIKRVMGASVQGGKGEDSILDAWVNNSIRALTTPDPRAITLSGPKVNSFFRNLADDVYRVTNDAWISNATNIDQGLLRVSPTAQQLAAGNPGYSPGYLALSARQREGGQMARMLPSEAQETIWSVAMPLMEGATKAGMHPREFLQRGLLTPDLIRGTPDFSSLLRNDPRYANIIQQMGRGEQLEKMQPFNFPRQLPEMTASDVANLEKTADTLGNLRERRQRESRSLFPGYTPEQDKTFAHVTTSGIPGRGTGVAEDLIDAPAGSRANFSSRVSNVFQDPTGMDILHKNLGLSPVSTVPSTEVWRPGMEGPVGGMGTSLAHATEYRPPLEVGRGYTASVEAPVTLNKSGQKIVDPAVERALEVASTLRGAMTAQHGTPHHALIGDPKGAGTAFTFPKKVDAGDQQARFGMLGALNTEPLAIADTGRTLSAFPWGKMEPFTDADRTWMKNLAGATEAIPVTNIAGKKSYVDLSSEFAQPEGSRAVAKRLTSSLNKLTPEEFGRLDNVELRRAAGDLHDMYASQNAKGNRVRPDFLNMLSIMRDKGLKGLQAAYRKKEFLPVLAALGLGDQMVSGTSVSGEQ